MSRTVCFRTTPVRLAVRLAALAALAVGCLIGLGQSASAQRYDDDFRDARPGWDDRDYGRRYAPRGRDDDDDGYRRDDPFADANRRQARQRWRGDDWNDDEDTDQRERRARRGLPDDDDDAYDDDSDADSGAGRDDDRDDERAEADEEASGGARPEIVAEAPPSVPFPSEFKPGSIVIDQTHKQLYFVLSEDEALRYPISVGREGFAWTGKEAISRIADWPDWHPPAEMRERDAKLPKKMTGGINNPLGAKAIYLGKTLYRIHGTNDPKSIGRAASSGCFRMTNENVTHLARLVQVGAEVHVLSKLPMKIAETTK